MYLLINVEVVFLEVVYSIVYYKDVYTNPMG